MPPTIEGLVDALQASVTDPEKKQLAAEIAVDLVRVGALAPTDPERAAELGQALKAQTSGLAASELSAWSGLVGQFLQRAAVAAITGALA